MFKIGCTAAVRYLKHEPLPDKVMLPAEIIDETNYKAWLVPWISERVQRGARWRGRNLDVVRRKQEDAGVNYSFAKVIVQSSPPSRQVLKPTSSRKGHSLWSTRANKLTRDSPRQSRTVCGAVKPSDGLEAGDVAVRPFTGVDHVAEPRVENSGSRVAACSADRAWCGFRGLSIARCTP